MRAATALCAVLVCAINLLVLVPYLTGEDEYSADYSAYWRAGAALYTALLVRLVGSEAVRLGRWAWLANPNPNPTLTLTLTLTRCASAAGPPGARRGCASAASRC